MKKLKVLIAQKSQSDVLDIQEFLTDQRLNLNIQYVSGTFFATNKKIEQWLPDIVITGQIFNDSYIIEKSIANTGYDIAQKKRSFKSSPKVYLFSNLDVRDPRGLFDGIITTTKRDGKFDQTLFPFLEKLSEMKN